MATQNKLIEGKFKFIRPQEGPTFLIGPFKNRFRAG